MNLFYAVIGYVLAVFILFDGLNRLDMISLVIGGLWLIVGIVYTVKYVKEIKKGKNSGERLEREV